MAGVFGENGGSRFGQNSSSDAGKIFVGGLSWETTVDDLRDHFEKYGSISDCRLNTDPSTGRSKGFGFITFEDTETVDKVLNDSHTLQGRNIEPQRAKARGAGGFGGSRDSGKKLFISGIDDEMSEAEIQDYFSTFGKVKDLHMPVDRESGQRRNFCFLEYESEADAESALNSASHSIAGKDLDVKKAKSDKNRFGGGGRGRGGFGGGFGGRGRGGGYRGGRGGYSGMRNGFDSFGD